MEMIMSTVMLTLPKTMDEIVNEITQFTNLRQDEVKYRVWQEALEIGWNVCQDVERYGVTPHCYDQAMANLYQDSHAFIFETLVYWARSGRENMTRIMMDRLQIYTKQTGKPVEQLRILMLGDGSGNDSLYFATQGVKVNYFDFPGSRNYQFVAKRFAAYGFLNATINIINDYQSILDQSYDVVISIDVLEHLPDPIKAISDIHSMLLPGGIALISDAFGDVSPNLPTHLRINLKYHGTTPFLFLKSDLLLTWGALSAKPMEFTKQESSTHLLNWLSLLASKKVLAPYLIAKLGIVKSNFKRLLNV
jgi:2-polyprenyl-3-methyl-5-hydroxy-6-metoxy-1,4-benzoquinol methylase